MTPELGVRLGVWKLRIELGREVMNVHGLPIDNGSASD
jgi:hypothetical protein